MYCEQSNTFYPKMADMMVIRSYAGLRPWTEDHLPIISRVNISQITL